MYKLPKINFILVTFFTLSMVFSSCDSGASKNSVSMDIDVKKGREEERLLRHIVLFKFNENATADIVKNIEEAFADLQNQIPKIQSFEWGLNNSPEGLNNGLTHCFFVTFLSEEDRAKYLPHPAHQKFVKLIGDYVESVTVFDYWTK